MKKTKFLIIRFSSIGDIVLTSPLIRCLKQQVEHAEIHFVTKSKYGELLEANPYIDKLHFLNDNFGHLIEELRGENPDFIIDLHQNIRSQRIKRTLRAPSYSFNKLNFRKWILVNLKINRLPNQHIVDRYFRTVSAFGVKPDGKGLDYFIPPGKGFDFTKLPSGFRDGYMAFILSGTYQTKQLPREKVIEICRSVTHPVILIGGEGEKEASEAVKQEAGDHVLNMVGKTTINESADLIRKARLVLTNDTGMMHIAAAFEKKILSFWGNTVPLFGMYPYKPHADSLIGQVEGLSCRPCSKLGYKECPRGHFRCMAEIDAEAAARWIEANFG